MSQKIFKNYYTRQGNHKMMPDRYDEIKKRLAVGQIKPEFQFDGQNLPITDYPEEQLEEPTRELAETSEAKEEYQGMDGQSAMYLGDAVASAGPALLSLLGGGSAAVVSGLFDKGNKYAQSRGAQEEITKANTSVIDVDGQPVNIRSRDAIGKKPYYQSKLGGKAFADPSSIQKTERVYDRATDSFKIMGITRGGQVVDLGLEPSMGVGSASGTDVLGSKSTVQYNKNDPSKKTPIKTTPGYGTLTGTPVQTQKDVNKLADKYAKDTDILETKKNELNNAVSIFSNPKATPTELTAAREALIRSVTAETRLTDNDVERALGNDFRTLLAQIGSSLSNKGFGEMSDAQKADFLTAAKTLSNRLENGLNFAYNKSKQRASALPGGKEAFEAQTPERTKSAKTAEAELIKVQMQAEKKYGKGTPAFEQFMQFYKSKKGI
jgi:hypothetical protein